MKIKLNSGIEVFVEAYNYTPTFAGVIAYSPSESTNQNLINHLNYPKEWGNRKCIMKKSDMFASENILKPIINSVWLSSNKSINDKNSDGSDLVVMFFSEENLDKTIQEIINHGVRNIDWEEFADNFQF
jgi:hypothetical protein